MKNCLLRLRDTVDRIRLEAYDEIHFVVPRNSIMLGVATVRVLRSLPRPNSRVHVIIFMHDHKCFADLANLPSNCSRR